MSKLALVSAWCRLRPVFRAIFPTAMARLGGLKWAGLVLALLLALNVVSALDLSRQSRRESEWEIERYGRRGGSRERERRYRRRGGEGEGERELRLEEPREWFRSEGGDIRVWDDLRPIEEADVYVRSVRITLRERGLALPKYDDAACIGYVEEGEGLVGFLSGYSLGETVKRVKRGDVVAFPRGVAHWWYNSGDQELRILGFADTSAGVVPGEFRAFSLVGGRGREEGRRYGREGQEEELGGILHGFSRDFLAEAWNVDESVVEELLDSQREVGIVRAEREIDVREFPGSGAHRRHQQRRRDDVDEVANPGAYQAGWGREREFSREQIGDFPADFVYNVREGTPDVLVPEAGYANVVDRNKLPLLAYVKLGLAHTRLERNAILAPHWSPTGHRVVHVLRGDGHLEIAGQGGQRRVSTRLREGDAYIIPRFFPAGIRAGEDGLEWISFYTTDVPYIEALAGKTSVYHNLPVQVAAAAFNIDEERVRECKRRRARHAILLPPAHYQGGRRERDIVNESTSASGLVKDPFLL